MKGSLLLVDDDRDIRELLVESLRTQGYEVYSAENGRLALEILKNNKVDLVLSDIQMPEMDGAQLMTKMNEFAESIPIILFISGASNLTAEEAFDLGAVGVLRKPFARKMLLETIQRIFENRKGAWKNRPPRHPNFSEIHLKFEGLAEARSSHLFNIGRGGAYVQAKPPMPAVGTQIYFDIQFADPHPISLAGIGLVRWTRQQESPGLPSGFGIEFIFIDEPGRSQLKPILNSLAKRAFIPKV